MQKGKVYRNDVLVGFIEKERGDYIFQYSADYLTSADAEAISINLPLTGVPFQSKTLFSYFANMLAEGSAAAIQCQAYRIDEKDLFSRLLKTASDETIGSITVREIPMGAIR
jgi:HipA-like protein